MTRSILVAHFLILAGLLLFSGTRCSPGITSPQKTSPMGSFQETLNPVAVTALPTTVVPHKDFTPVPIKPFMKDVEIAEKALETVTQLTKPLTITLVYDNNVFDQRLKSAWGFSALVEYHDNTLLFDTGGDGPMLMENMRILGIDPTQIESIVLSHAHGDHIGGLSALLELGARPVVYLPPSFSTSLKSQVGSTTEVIEVMPGQPITKDIFTTGEMGKSIPEQALVIKTRSGLVIITGCAHPGIIEIVRQAREISD